MLLAWESPLRSISLPFVNHYLAVLLSAKYNSWIDLSSTDVCHVLFTNLERKSEHHIVTKNYIDISEHWGMARILNLI